MEIGIAIAVANVLIIVGALVWKHLSWKKNFPTLVQNMGVRYTQGAVEWTGMDKVISLLNSKLTAKYGAEFTAKLLSHTWIEVVGPQGSRTTPTTVVSEAARIAGSIDVTREYPWSAKYYIAVVLQRKEYVTADDGAIFHEIVKHIVPFVKGQGVNADHSMPEYNALENDLHFAYKQMKA